MRMLVNSYIREVDRVGRSERRVSCAVMLQEEERHGFSKIRRAVSLEIARQAILKLNYYVRPKTDIGVEAKSF